MKASEIQVGGSHYKSAKIQPVTFIEANQLGFLEGCVVKRLVRHNKPTGKGRQDIEKAIHELQLLLEHRYADAPSEAPVPAVPPEAKPVEPRRRGTPAESKVNFAALAEAKLAALGLSAREGWEVWPPMGTQSAAEVRGRAPTAPVQYRLRNGTTAESHTADGRNLLSPADWDTPGAQSDIVAYRVIED